MGVPMDTPRIAVSVLNYRTPDLTLRAVAAAARALAGLRAEIFVTDNDSRDGSFQRFEREAPSAAGEVPLRLLRSKRNRGFGAGNNIAIRAALSGDAPADVVYILNPDAFPEPGAVRALVAALAHHPEAGIAGSYICGEDGAPHHTAFRFPSILGEFEGAARIGPISRALHRHRVAPDLPLHTGPVDWLAGASMMIRREVFESAGLFDETFFLYFEETDLCRRAAAAGWSTLYVRESEVVHIGSVSTGMKAWQRVPGYWFRSRRHYFTKTHGRAYAIGATGAHVAGVMLRRLRGLAGGGASAGEPAHLLRDLLAEETGLRARDARAGS